MAPKKQQLLDLLREQKGRREAPGGTGGPSPSPAPSQPRRPLPPWIPLVAAVVVLGGLVWLLSGFFGGSEQFAVHAATWFGEAQQTQAVEESRGLRAQLPEGTEFDLRISDQADGTARYDLYVGSAGSKEGLAELLSTIRTASLPNLPAGARPFADATVALLTEPTP